MTTSEKVPDTFGGVFVDPPKMSEVDLAAFATEASRVDPHGTDIYRTIDKMSRARAAAAKPVGA